MDELAMPEMGRKMIKKKKLLLAYYGDDFTGSTDALEFLSNAGAKTMLFTEPPLPEQLERYEGLQAVGVGGMTRAMGPDAMERALRPAFTALQSLGASHIHYKVCSTFDSSPAIGSIGKAIDLGREIFRPPFVPLVVAAPALGRYCVFGNLFARMGAGSDGEIFRLDRHPSMSRHPVTPSDESDLRLHLGRQTSGKTELLNILQIGSGVQQAGAALEAIVKAGAEIVLFDGLYAEQMALIGELIDSYTEAEKSLFSAGSSGIEMALGGYWLKQGVLQGPAPWPNPGKAASLLVVSGSCSPVTSAQIAWAVSKGFAEIIIDDAVLKELIDIDDDDLTGGSSVGYKRWPGMEKYAAEAGRLIREGRSVIVHTGGKEGVIATPHSARVFGSLLGDLVKEMAAASPLKRVVVAGGDTSGYATRAMGIEAVEMIAPLSPGAPLCKAHAPGSSVDGLELNFKGGQVGPVNYFNMALNGK